MPHDDEELRKLWQRQAVKEEQVMSVELLVEHESKFTRIIHLRNAVELGTGALGIAGSAFVAGFAPQWFAAYVFGGWRVPNWPIQVEFGLIASALAFTMHRLWRDGTPLAEAPRSATLPVHLAHYRAELERQRTLMRRAYLWGGAPGIPAFVFGVGYATMYLHDHGTLAANLSLLPTVIGFTVGLFAVYLYGYAVAAKKVQQKIDALEM